jgi:hypothetical protein
LHYWLLQIFVYKFLFGTVPEKTYAGVDATKAYLNFIKSNKTNYFELFTAIHSWYKHKMGIYRRFIYINDTADNGVIKTELISKYNDIVTHANAIRMLSIKITSKQNDTMLLSRVISKLDEINTMEKDVLSNLY